MTTIRHFRIRAQDSLFFRDGRPFNQSDEGLALAHSHFPPFPSTMSGAVRTALATVNGGWDLAVLGDGPDNLGQLTFGPPTPVRDQDGGLDLLYPLPPAILGHADQDGLLRLAPGTPLECDMGPAVPLPQLAGAPGPGWKSLPDRWVTAAGLSRFLAGGVPDRNEILSVASLWQSEPRIGLARDHRTRGALEGMLYTTSHIRMQETMALAVEITGLPETWQNPRMLPLGGEGRFAWIDASDDTPAHAPVPPIAPDALVRSGQDACCYTVVLLSHLCLGKHPWPAPGGALADLPGQIVAACQERTIRIGGWNSRDYGSSRGGPRPLRAFLPAGSVFFMEAPRAKEQTILQKHLLAIGEGTSHGFGQIAIGTYASQKEGFPA
ncbi:MAG: type III-B CRISPR module-associated protein Cmr3 [Magnetococcus sp. YQC-9]